jgi:hypothetical protein
MDFVIPVLIIVVVMLALAIDGQPKRDRLYGKRLTGGPERPNVCDHPNGHTHIAESADPPRVNGLAGGVWAMAQPCRHNR